MSAQWGHGFHTGLQQGRGQGAAAGSLAVLVALGLVQASRKLIDKRKQKKTNAENDQSGENPETETEVDPDLDDFGEPLR